jgi:hypothetical protein
MLDRRGWNGVVGHDHQFAKISNGAGRDWRDLILERTRWFLQFRSPGIDFISKDENTRRFSD